MKNIYKFIKQETNVGKDISAVSVERKIPLPENDTPLKIKEYRILAYTLIKYYFWACRILIEHELCKSVCLAPVGKACTHKERRKVEKQYFINVNRYGKKHKQHCSQSVSKGDSF